MYNRRVVEKTEIKLNGGVIGNDVQLSDLGNFRTFAGAEALRRVVGDENYLRLRNGDQTEQGLLDNAVAGMDKTLLQAKQNAGLKFVRSLEAIDVTRQILGWETYYKLRSGGEKENAQLDNVTRQVDMALLNAKQRQEMGVTRELKPVVLDSEKPQTEVRENDYRCLASVALVRVLIGEELESWLLDKSESGEVRVDQNGAARFENLVIHVDQILEGSRKKPQIVRERTTKVVAMVDALRVKRQNSGSSEKGAGWNGRVRGTGGKVHVGNGKIGDG